MLVLEVFFMGIQILRTFKKNYQTSNSFGGALFLYETFLVDT